MAEVRFDQVNLVSGDPERSVAFYRLLGVALPDASLFADERGIHHANAPSRQGPASFELDSVVFAQAWNPQWKGQAGLAGRLVLGFRVEGRDAVDAAFDRLIAAGHPAILPPHDAFWGARYAIVEDPDGVAVGIMSPRSGPHRSPPPF